MYTILKKPQIGFPNRIDNNQLTGLRRSGVQPQKIIFRDMRRLQIWWGGFFGIRKPHNLLYDFLFLAGEKKWPFRCVRTAEQNQETFIFWGRSRWSVFFVSALYTRPDTKAIKNHTHRNKYPSSSLLHTYAVVGWKSLEEEAGQRFIKATHKN